MKKKFCFILILLLVFFYYTNFITDYSIKFIKNNKRKYKLVKGNNHIFKRENNIINSYYERCYFSSDNFDLKINHLIITRFMIERLGVRVDISPKKICEKNYILNGIRVMKKYLIPSLENQSCKEFTLIIMLGDKANKTFIESLINFNKSFELKLVYKRDIKNYIRNNSKGFEVLITTRIDYDDRIYYDAVNDVRKAININKPMILYGYNRGLHFYENENKYYEFFINYRNNGTMSIFLSLIVVLNKVNDTYYVYDLGLHTAIRSKLLTSYTSFGIKTLNYEPAIFDSGGVKFVWVRHNFSGTLNYSKYVQKHLKEKNFNIMKFYGK